MFLQGACPRDIDHSDAAIGVRWLKPDEAVGMIDNRSQGFRCGLSLQSPLKDEVQAHEVAI